MDRAEQTVMQIGRGYQLSQALYVAAKLGVADVLRSEPLPAEVIAEAVDVRAHELRRVLRALVAAGVFCELEDGRFAANDAAAALRTDAPGRMRDVVVNFGVPPAASMLSSAPFAVNVAAVDPGVLTVGGDGQGDGAILDIYSSIIASGPMVEVRAIAPQATPPAATLSATFGAKHQTRSAGAPTQAVTMP